MTMTHPEILTLNPIHIGMSLASVRDRSGLTQAELGKRVTLTQTVLSRIESGDRPASDDELASILEAIGTEEAKTLLGAVQRKWSALEPPPLDHPDADLLWQIDQAIAELRDAGQDDEIRPAFARRLDEYERELLDNAKSLSRRDHEVALIGPIGVGKSTAICWATGLQADGARDEPVLFTGAGGSTLCEVRLRVGRAWGLVIEPKSIDDIAIDVNAFAESLLRSLEPSESDGAAPVAELDDNMPSVPSEVERAIRNMSGLARSSKKGPDGKSLKDTKGKVVRVDPAIDLASAVGKPRELALEILDRMNLHRRDRREEWLPESSSADPKKWLRTRFRDINNGNHPDFSMPAHVEVIVPQLLDVEGLSVSIVDTRGIDERAARVDIDARLEDEHTVSLLCSGFNDSPNAAVKNLLARAREVDNKLLDTHAALLVLPRSSEPMAVKHDDGEPVESADEGCDLKEDKIRTDLQRFGAQDIQITFFNYADDEPSKLADFIVARVMAARDVLRARATNVATQAAALVANAAEEQVLAVQRDASSYLLTWLRQHAELAHRGGRAHQALLASISGAYAATVRASVRREGAWDNLNFNHELGHGARRLAVETLQTLSGSFQDHCQTVAGRSPEAAELVGHAERLMTGAYAETLQRMQIAGQTLWKESFIGAELWGQCESEWGGGPGYKNRVLDRNRNWLAGEPREELEEQLSAKLDREWQGICQRLRDILEEV